jgi:hypothetical protein
MVILILSPGLFRHTLDSGGLVVHSRSFRQFPPVSASFRPPIRRKPAAGGYIEAPDIVDESKAPDSDKGFPVFPVFPPDVFASSLRQRRVANAAGTPSRASTARPPDRRARAAVATEPST